MRKIVVLMMVSLDGVMQSPSEPDEDPSLGFKYGGWSVPYVDGYLGNVLSEEMSMPFDMLLGAKTYEIFTPYWPSQIGTIADAFNRATKYVVSDKPIDLAWKESILIKDNVVAKIKVLKEEDGPMLQVWGSGNLVQTLLHNDLVDELRLRIFPVTIGSGQRLFAGGTAPAAFELLDSQALPSGIIIANYKRAGEFRVGSLA